ncbi:MAG: ABC transporter ATP-binding protein [Phycisphaeraceae bacterium]|nr:MAG: ABC transporter ATP-binding protein [Phycisphaeraceae bacterium]
MTRLPVIEVREARRIYRARGRRRGRTATPARVALDGVSLNVGAGEWLALLGPNGSGKSTLLRILATLDSPQSGAVRRFGVDAESGSAALADVRRRLGVVFQSPGLDPLLTVRENLACQAALFGMRLDAGAEAIERIAAEAGVFDRMNDRVGALSGGLARRVDLARALLPSPELLLLDEPTTGLDHAARSGFMESLDRLHSAGAVTIVMTTHLMDEAERADRVVMLAHGRIVGEGPPGELRRELGGAVARTSAEHRRLLEEAGLHVAPARDGVIGSGELEAVERAASALTRAGASFHIGPPTLGDVYLGLTGMALSSDGAAANRSAEDAS